MAQAQFEQALAMGASYEQAKQKAQRALDEAEKEYDQNNAERTAYADAVAQQQYESFLASGYSYQQALNEGQAALNFAEADYDAMIADQQANLCLDPKFQSVVAISDWVAPVRRPVVFPEEGEFLFNVDKHCLSFFVRS